jgi:carbamoyltransferase
MNILGIHYGHNATVAYIKDGKLEFAMSEERFNRLKNSNGFPVLTLDYVYKNYINPNQVDKVVIFQKDIAGYLGMKRVGFKSVRDFGTFNVNFQRKYSFKKHVLSKIPGINFTRSFVGKSIKKFYAWKDRQTQESLKYFSKMLQVPSEKISFSFHHASHAYAACMNLDEKKKTLVITMDGEGDGESSTVSVYENFKLEKLSSNPVSVSLGYFFTEITKFLGMTPNEHEFKVMGLAPYAKQEKARELYERFKDLVVLNKDLEFESKIPTNKLEYYFLENLYAQRFDTVSAFAQIFLEEKVLEWVKAWVSKTGIRELAVSGGVFMSVKLNQKISELPEVDSLFVMPSGADESTAIGAAFFGYLEKNTEINMTPSPVKFTDLYLGNSYSSSNIREVLKNLDVEKKFDISEFKNEFEIEKQVAKLLSENQVVARFKGRTEWGARALGNRSILANPTSRDNLRIINEMIKNRDFWMPFAASVLEEDEKRYLINSKNIKAPYMAITFPTTELGQKHLPAAIHPYDFTCRPQIVYKDWNKEYYTLISEFKSLTGIGGVLNTSFNLHGEPNVESPKDALRTLENSGLKYLAIENYLISKK